MTEPISSVMAAAYAYRQPKPTRAQLRAFCRLARGDRFSIDTSGAVRFRNGDSVLAKTVKVLVDRAWATAPLPELPLFN